MIEAEPVHASQWQEIRERCPLACRCPFPFCRCDQAAEFWAIQPPIPEQKRA